MTGDQHIARALHAVLQRQGMPVKIISSRAMQVMVDMLHDLMERIMDEAATCADSKGRVTIASGSIRTGAMLVLQYHIDAYCPHVKMAMISFAGQRYTARTTSIGSRRKQRQLRRESPPPPLRIGPVQHHYGFDPFQIAS